MKKFIPTTTIISVADGKFSQDWADPNFDEKYKKVISRNADILEYQIMLPMDADDDHIEKLVGQIDRVICDAGLGKKYQRSIQKSESVMYMEKNLPIFNTTTKDK